MRWKIIIVNAGIVIVVGLLTYVLLATSLKDVLANQAERKREVAQALRAADSQLALDALRMERWLDSNATAPSVHAVLASGTADARSEAATAEANRLRDAAVSEPMFAKMAPSLVLIVDAQGVAVGRNGSALMRGENVAAAYPSLAESLKSGHTASALWLNHKRQEQMLTSYAPLRGDNGAVVGAFVGIFLINAFGAARVGVGYRISFDVRNAAFREWVRLSIPLMLGVSLVTADDWILRYFAAGSVGDITRLNYAKRLFAVPIAVLGQAASQASLPFFARLFGEKRLREFAETVNGSIYRIVSVALLASSFMTAAALPLIDLVYRRGHLLFSDSQTTAVYFFWFSLSLAFWSAQGLYARAFYAAGNTLTPMIASDPTTR